METLCNFFTDIWHMLPLETWALIGAITTVLAIFWILNTIRNSDIETGRQYEKRKQLQDLIKNGAPVLELHQVLQKHAYLPTYFYVLYTNPKNSIMLIQVIENEKCGSVHLVKYIKGLQDLKGYEYLGADTSPRLAKGFIKWIDFSREHTEQKINEIVLEIFKKVDDETNELTEDAFEKVVAQKMNNYFSDVEYPWSDTINVYCTSYTTHASSGLRVHMSIMTLYGWYKVVQK